MAMRLLILSQYYEPEIGAPQTRLSAVARELVSRGHAVRVLTAYPNYPTGRVFPSYRHSRGWRREGGLEVRRCWIFPVKSAGMSRLFSYCSFLFSSLWPLILTCRGWSPDYVFIESPPLFLGISGMLAKRLTGVPYIFNVADLWPDWAVEARALRRNGWSYRCAKWLERRIYARSAFVTIVVDRMRQALLTMGVDAAKILFLPNGARVAAPDSTDRKLSAAARDLMRRCGKRKVVLYAGNHGRFHALPSLIRAAACCRDRSDAVFVFVGDGSEKRAAIELADRERLENVLFADPLRPVELDEVYGFTTVALASYIRGFNSRSAKMFPAMAAGVPVVMSGEGEGSDLLERARAGIVAPPEEPERIASAVRALLDSETLARDLGANGKRFISQHLSWSILVGSWLQQLGTAERAHVGT